MWSRLAGFVGLAGKGRVRRGPNPTFSSEYLKFFPFFKGSDAL